MNKIIMLFAALTMVACNSQPKTDTEAPNKEAVSTQAAWEVVVLNVEGMTCEGCENAIRAGIETLPGIAEVESSHEEAFTRVKFDKNVTTVEEISEKITETGYTVKGEI
ncbi:MAG: cation transporter [Bacteroidota bacterium]